MELFQAEGASDAAAADAMLLGAIAAMLALGAAVVWVIRRLLGGSGYYR